MSAAHPSRNPSQRAAFPAAEAAARDSYGRLLAYLSRRCGDIATAEDALAEAFASALERWPTAGVPDEPAAWLLTVARSRLVDGTRRAARAERFSQQQLAALLSPADRDPAAIPDERLGLMLVCAHPAIDGSVRSALMLQTVLGLPVRAMAPAFLLSADQLAKRLVRAKAGVREAGLGFEVPEVAELLPRLHAVLEAVYAAYFIGRDGTSTDPDPPDDLRREAVAIACLVTELLPDSPEALGLLAVLVFCEARRPAAVSTGNEFVPLSDQDPGLWDRRLMRRGYDLVARAAAFRRAGPFQWEAAIQAAHCSRARSGVTPWAEIAALYDRLVAEHATVGARVGRAVAHAHDGDRSADGLALLDQIDSGAVRDYQPYWVARAHVLERVGRPAEARACVERAVGLTSHPRVRRFLLGRLERFGTPAHGERQVAPCRTE